MRPTGKDEKDKKRSKRATQNCVRCKRPFDLWRSQCPFCRQFNFTKSIPGKGDGTVLASDVKPSQIEYISTGPWDECFGRRVNRDGTISMGLPTVSVVLISGDPGAGKSTLVTTLADILIERTGKEVLYIIAEEGEEQARDRLDRLGVKNLDKFRFCLPHIELNDILTTRKYAAWICDSLPRYIPNPDDAVTFAKNLKEYCTAEKTPAILINHIVKGGDAAGAQALQHEVDTTLDFRPDDDDRNVRWIDVVKSRFGPVMSQGFRMTQGGLVALEKDAPLDDDDDDDDDEDEDEDDDEDQL